jgi:NAD(P)-dependent dehydrogenase (short-subunit alcohol dehydrogenase family)
MTKNKMCEGRICAVTGAGRGIGREYALLLAAEGAKVVVNDFGGARDGSASGGSNPAQDVVDEIKAAGGDAVAHLGDASSYADAQAMVKLAIDTYGGIDVVVNNAGILRDRMLFSMSEEEWDSVIKVHLKGTWASSRVVAEYWRNRAKEGLKNDGRIINTTSVSGNWRATESRATRWPPARSPASPRIWVSRRRCWRASARSGWPRSSRGWLRRSRPTSPVR